MNNTKNKIIRNLKIQRVQKYIKVSYKNMKRILQNYIMVDILIFYDNCNLTQV